MVMGERSLYPPLSANSPTPRASPLPRGGASPLGPSPGAGGEEAEKPAVCVQGDCHGYLPDKTNGST